MTVRLENKDRVSCLLPNLSLGDRFKQSKSLRQTFPSGKASKNSSYLHRLRLFKFLRGLMFAFRGTLIFKPILIETNHSHASMN